MRRDAAIVIFAVALAGAYLYETFRMPRLSVGDPLGPKIFPIIIGGALLLGGVMLLLEVRVARTQPPEEDAGSASWDWRPWLPLAALVVWTFLYFSLFETLGYVLSTAIYLFALMAVLRRGQLLTNLATAVVFTLCTSFVFTELLDVRLARGLLSF